MGLQENDYIYMTSYLFYAIAGTKSWPRLNRQGVYDDTTIIYNHLPQIQYNNTLHHFRRVNDAFTMLTVREIQGNTGLRFSLEAAMKVQKYGSVLIQFPKFTSIILASYDVCPLMLSRFVDDKLVLIEMCR